MPQIPEYIRATSMVFCIIIMCLGVIGNIMVPIVILKTKDMRNSTNIFLTNLSIADLLVLLVCTPTVLVEVNSPPEVWVLGEEMCKAVPFVELTVAHASVLTILAISFERYYAICEPLKAGYVCTKARALVICLAAWTVAAILTSPILMISSYEYVEYVNGKMVASCLTPVENFWPAAFFVASIVVFFIFPLFILVILYSVIAKNLMDNPGIIMSNASGSRNNVLKYRKQVIIMLGAVVVSFFFCLLPFRALTLWIIVVPSEVIVSIGIERFYIILYFCRIMLYMNSAVNPILYNLMSSKFRNGFLQLLGCSKLIRSDTLSSGARKGTFHTTSTNLSSSHNSSSQRRFTRDEGSVSGSVRTIAENSSRKRLLYHRHSSTVSIRSSYDEIRDGVPVLAGSCLLETSPLKANIIDELDETSTLPNSYDFLRCKQLTAKCNVSCTANSCNNKTSHRLNGSISVEPTTIRQIDNKYLVLRKAVVVVRKVEEQPSDEQRQNSTEQISPGEPSGKGPPGQETTLILEARGSKQHLLSITAKEAPNGNCASSSPEQNTQTDKGCVGVSEMGAGKKADSKHDPNRCEYDDGEGFDEITKIRQFYGSMECDI
ncbi:gastrin-releasing peptide receptor isoform X1 [Topomyia yanbarensis]|uniref:gastrin-releasing peptide receptor isoform X1 n=1 Tax=Topomyia yanbarensis TaxID=2498891 RepID=UPI00273C10B5|nr:gastrin-releasing peptide receptor isoform X1 [Topomyia yanbarensis]